MKKYRHELKYICNEMELAVITERLRPIIRLDKNVAEEGFYNIRSLYFDDYYNTCFAENEAGTDPREKFRIRIYNASADNIKLELKKKERGKTFKESCPITKEQCELLMRGIPCNVEMAKGSKQAVLNKLLLLMKTRLMKPVVIVDYDRVPYVYKDGNVRITLDRNISSGSNIHMFLERDIAKRPIMPAGQHVLEVKYDEFLPDFIAQNLEIGSLRQTAFSKFYLCRKYSMGNF